MKNMPVASESRVAPLVQKLILATAALALFYASIEWGFLHFFTLFFTIDEIPRKFENPQGVWPVMQSSKTGFLPRNYILLIGDSYAMGMGDAIYTEPDRHHPRFGSAHVIQDLTGKDVINYGALGSGSIRAMIGAPIAGEEYLRRMISASLEKPAWVLIYFYAGNDMTENWLYYQKTFEPFFPEQDYDDPAVFGNYLQSTVIGRDHLYLSAIEAKPLDRLFFFQFCRRLYIENVLDRHFQGRKYDNELSLSYEPQYKWTPRRMPDPVNHAYVNGGIVPLPDNLQGPSLDLTEQQLQHAMGSFDKALAFAAKHFQNSGIAVVYIPSVLECYDLAGTRVHTQNFFDDNAQVFDVAALQRRANWLRQQVRQISTAHGVFFVDTTDDLRNAASTGLIHGPKDWNHLSKTGYQVLGQSIARRMHPYWAGYVDDQPRPADRH